MKELEIEDDEEQLIAKAQEMLDWLKLRDGKSITFSITFKLFLTKVKLCFILPSDK